MKNLTHFILFLIFYFGMKVASFFSFQITFIWTIKMNAKFLFICTVLFTIVQLQSNFKYGLAIFSEFSKQMAYYQACLIAKYVANLQ